MKIKQIAIGVLAAVLLLSACAPAATPAEGSLASSAAVSSEVAKTTFEFGNITLEYPEAYTISSESGMEMIEFSDESGVALMDLSGLGVTEMSKEMIEENFASAQGSFSGLIGPNGTISPVTEVKVGAFDGYQFLVEAEVEGEAAKIEMNLFEGNGGFYVIFYMSTSKAYDEFYPTYQAVLDSVK